ncbi:MAG: Ger(x)C family spore germination protein [Bacillota bacterium]
MTGWPKNKSSMVTKITRSLLIPCLLAIAATQPGCWDQREVERLGIVLATAVETAPEGKIRIIVQNVDPSAMKGGVGGGGGGGVSGEAGKPYRNRSAEGDTIFDAVRDLSRQTPRQLFFAHNQVIIISEKLAQGRGIAEVMDFFERNPQIRRTTWVLVGKGDLTSLLDEPGRIERTPAQRIFGIISERALTSQYGVKRLGNFLEMMESEGSQPFTAIIERKQNIARPDEQRATQQEGHTSEPHQNITMSGTAVFRRDKMVGQLDPKESRGLLWVRGEVKGGIIDISAPGGKRQVSLEILRSSTRLEPGIRDGRISMTIKIKEESNLVETTAPLDLTKPETVERLEKLLAGAIRGEVESALAKAQQEYRADVFGFGEEIHRKYPRQWKEIKDTWSDIFPGVEVEVQVDAKIRRTGLVTKPVQPKQR